MRILKQKKLDIYRNSSKVLNVPCAEIQAVRTFGLAKGGRGEEKRSWWLFCDFLIIFNPTHVFDLADD